MNIQEHFHWKFWKPKQCIGGPVYLGRWVSVSYWDGSEYITTEQSWEQYLIKVDMGLFR